MSLGDSIQNASQRGTISTVNNCDALVKAIGVLTKQIEVKETRGRHQDSARSHTHRRSSTLNIRQMFTEKSSTANIDHYHRNQNNRSGKAIGSKKFIASQIGSNGTHNGTSSALRIATHRLATGTSAEQAQFARPTSPPHHFHGRSNDLASGHISEQIGPTSYPLSSLDYDQHTKDIGTTRTEIVLVIDVADSVSRQQQYDNQQFPRVEFSSK